MKAENMNKDELTRYVKLDGVAVATMQTIDLQGEIDKRMRKVFKLVESDSPVVSKIANAVIRDVVDTQRALFKSKGLNPDRALKECMVGYTDDNGSMRWRIVPRKATLDEIDNGNENGDHAISIAASKTYSVAMGIERDQRRGKYNDAGLLFEQSAASVDKSEVVPFAAPF